MSYIAKIKKYDVSNGESIRTSVFLSGCTHMCDGCFQPETWSFTYGYEYTNEVRETIKEYLNDNNVKGVSLLGGDPMHPNNLETTLDILNLLPKDKTAYLWTGYLIDELVNRDVITNEILSKLDKLIDGKFDKTQKDLTLTMMGSRNQKIYNKEDINIKLNH